MAASSSALKALHKMGLRRDMDMALHLPLRYEDETRLTPVGQLLAGHTFQCEGTISDCRVELRPRRQLVAHVRDGTGEAVLRFVNFYPSHQKTLSVGARIRFRGEVRSGFWGPEMVHPTFRAVPPDSPLPTHLSAVYPTTAQLPQAYLRKAIGSAMGRLRLEEVLPASCVPAGLPSLRESLWTLHQPRPSEDLARLEDRTHPAWQRLKFEELLAQQIAQAQAREQRALLRSPALRGEASAAQRVVQGLQQALPFALTAAQRRVVAQIENDLGREQPMNRLLQGDVGSGKTVVAALAAARALDSGWQCALMAPTEILAEQHFAKLVQWLRPLGVEVVWLSGSRKGKARSAALAAVADGSAHLVVGTHAVIQADVMFARLGLAIVDEQHRFGVAQRLALRHKPEGADLEPHLLMMSATPIPRTLAMTYFADLDVSTLDELPPGRSPVVTKVFDHGRRDEVMGRVRQAVEQGQQVYWVCPLIEESEAIDLQNATDTHAQLSTVLAGHAVGLLHGRLPSAQKAEVMAQFAAGHFVALVATTVIEVGVDVPNASLMIIEHAERFGLAQLHQLRGRVGRGCAASTCVLLYSPPLSAAGKARLKAMAQTTDGFEIARRDLEIRGPGEFLGAQQSGDALLRFADLSDDQPLLEAARKAAVDLMRTHSAAAHAHVDRWLGTRTEFLKA